MAEYQFFIMQDIEESTAKEFAEFLAKVEDSSTVRLHILSHGGLVFAGLGICQMMESAKSRGIRFIAQIFGIAASAASDIALACNEILMAEGSQIMIHSAWGGSDEGIEISNALQMELIRRRIPDYSEKDLKEDRWFDAKTAIEIGLADGYIKGSNETRAVAKLAAFLSKTEGSMGIEEVKKEEIKNEEVLEEKIEEQASDENPDDEPKAEDLDLMEAIVQRLEGIERRLGVLEGEGKKADDEGEPVVSASARRKALMQKLSAVCAPVPSAVKPVAVAETPEQENARFKAMYKNFDDMVASYIKRK